MLQAVQELSWRRVGAKWGGAGWGGVGSEGLSAVLGCSPVTTQAAAGDGQSYAVAVSRREGQKRRARRWAKRRAKKAGEKEKVKREGQRRRSKEKGKEKGKEGRGQRRRAKRRAKKGGAKEVRVISSFRGFSHAGRWPHDIHCLNFMHMRHHCHDWHR